MKKIVICWIFLSIFAFAGAAVAADIAQIVKAAEKEGEVYWTGTLKDDEAAPFVKAFNKDYPQIKVIYEREHGAESQERMVREIQGGAPAKDVVLLHVDYRKTFLEDFDAMETVNWADFNVLPQLISEKNRLVALNAMTYCIVYNSKLVKKEEAPKNWEDFLDPKWKGKFISDTRPNALMCLAGVWGDEKVLQYAKKLGANKPIFVRGQTQAMTLMAAGDYMLSPYAMYSSAVYVAQKGGPLAWNFTNPVPLHFQPYGVLKKCPHPNAGKVFLGWLGSKGYLIMDDVNPGRSVPFGGTQITKQLEGKTLSFPPSEEQVSDRQAFQKQIMANMGFTRKQKQK